MEFTPIGGGLEIGANCYVLSAEGRQVILDCGLHPKKEGAEALPELWRLVNTPDAVIVTHGHIDHCGAAPILLREFPEIECYATIPTVRIMDRMLHNSVSVMGTLAIEQGIADYPLYTHTEVDHTIRQTFGLAFDRPFALSWDSPFEASFHPAGHVLGSASVAIRAPGHTVLYTGDVCIARQELMAGLALPDDLEVDTLIIESTRGAAENGHRVTYRAEVGRFVRAVRTVLNNGGTVLVPSFALGRTQELLNIIARQQEAGKLPEVPVYASGLGRAVYEVYSKYTEYLRPGAELCPLQSFERVGDVWERSVRRDLLREPCIIVATSGMMVENTPSSMIAMEMVHEQRHGIFFVGYLDPDTLGYKLLHANTGDELVFERKGRATKVLLENRQSFTLSAHADRDELRRLITKLSPKNVVFVHGDPEAVLWMRENSGDSFRKFAPALGETVTLEA